ncbi:MAG: CbiX/SirB N-terminal domain-containing protein [Candidatus Thorarchaeota archaeon]|nr:MAG: CbiX/SirB N-terminal domain-containing protein [Candidatus Thorarchaeota archaeon]
MPERTTIVLAMHGSPPTDFPREELVEFFGIHFRLEHVSQSISKQERARHDDLERRIRSWPRTSENDPYWNASQVLAQELSNEIGLEVVVGFNEFCEPSIDGSIEAAIESGSGKVTVVTPMMTKGGEHSEVDIPEAIERIQERYPEARIIYAWPYEVSEVAKFLAEQIQKLS